MSTTEPSPLFVGRKELARLFSISLRTVDLLVARNSIPSTKLGGRRLFNVELVRAAVIRGDQGPRREG